MVQAAYQFYRIIEQLAALKVGFSCQLWGDLTQQVGIGFCLKQVIGDVLFAKGDAGEDVDEVVFFVKDIEDQLTTSLPGRGSESFVGKAHVL